MGINEEGYEVDEIKVNEEGKWKTEVISKQFEEKYPMFEGAQWIGFESKDEPNQISYMINSSNGIAFIEVFFEIVGDKELNIKKIKFTSTGEEIDW